VSRGIADYMSSHEIATVPDLIGALKLEG
jgi:hypothetical protein